jgi:hypothetical protein
MPAAEQQWSKPAAMAIPAEGLSQPAIEGSGGDPTPGSGGPRQGIHPRQSRRGEVRRICLSQKNFRATAAP